MAGTVPVLETTQAALPRLLFSGMSLPFEATDPCQEPGFSHSHPAHPVPQGHEHMELFETWSIRSEYVYSVTELRQNLKNMPAGVLRLKGFLRTDQHGWSELQFSGRHGSLQPVGFESSLGERVVAIGLKQQLPHGALDALFKFPLLNS